MKVLYGFFNLIAKFIGWLLVALGLWVPLVYCVVFLLVCVFAGIPLPEAAGIFYFGLLLSLIGSAMIIVTRPVKFIKENYKGGKQKTAQNHQPVRKKGQDIRPDYKDKGGYLGEKKKRRIDDYFTEEEYEEEDAEPEYAPPPPVKKSKNNLYHTETKKPKKIVEPAASRPQAAQYGGGQYYNQPQQAQYPQNNYGQPQGQYIPGYAPQAQYPQAQQPQYPPLYNHGQPDYGYSQAPQEQSRQAADGNPYFSLNQDAPLIFRTKQDPSILIYEYFDRIEVYRQAAGGLSLINVQSK